MMADKTKIEWTQRPGTVGATWNPIRARNKETGGVGHFCIKVGVGCVHCYAERLQKRFRNQIRYAAQDVNQVDIFLDENVLTQPLRWRQPHTVFPCSMTDLFGPWVTDEMLDRIFAVMALTPQHTYLPLTKRPARMREYMTTPHGPRCTTILDDGSEIPTPAAHIRVHAAMCDMFKDAPARALNDAVDWQDKHYPGGDGFIRRWPLPNVWCGTSVSTQADADAHIPDLLATPAAVRFLSAEPLLGPVDFLSPIRDIFVGAGYGVESRQEFAEAALAKFWVIAGGESGPGARPMHPDWARSMRDRCQAAGVPFFFKQWGEWLIGEPSTKPDDDGNVFGLPISFQDSGEFDVNSDGEDIVFAAAVDEKEGPRPIWREYHGWQGHLIKRVGKKAAGALLDGREHKEWPQVSDQRTNGGDDA
jgi:protein gp37